MQKIINIELTKSGLPALWERGGGMTNTGSVQLIADHLGNPKYPIYIKRRGQRACNNHALFVINKNDIVLQANHHRGDIVIKIYKISQIFTDGKAELTSVNEYSQGEWEHNNTYEQLVKVSRQKIKIYHCKYPMFYIKDL